MKNMNVLFTSFIKQSLRICKRLATRLT